MAKQRTQISCKNVFMSGESTTTKSQFTKKWIELVNRIEKSKKDLLGKP